MVEVIRKKGETFESLLRKFTRKVIQSGKLLTAREIQYYVKEKSRNRRRTDAVRREEMRQEREYLRKIGALKEEAPTRRY